MTAKKERRRTAAVHTCRDISEGCTAGARMGDRRGRGKGVQWSAWTQEDSHGLEKFLRREVDAVVPWPQSRNRFVHLDCQCILDERFGEVVPAAATRVRRRISACYKTCNRLRPMTLRA
jgi:hypothetical protein